MYFGQICLLFSPWQFLPYLPYIFPSTNFMCSLFLFSNTNFVYLTLLLLCRGGDHTGAWVSSQGPYFWRKQTIPPPEAISFHTASQMGWDVMKFPLSLMLVCWLPWSCADLYTWCRVLWAHTCGCAITSVKSLTIRHLLPWILQYLHPLCYKDSWASRGEAWCSWSIQSWGQSRWSLKYTWDWCHLVAGEKVQWEDMMATLAPLFSP